MWSYIYVPLPLRCQLKGKGNYPSKVYLWSYVRRRQGNFCACAKNLCIITEWHRGVYLLNEILLRVTLKMACYYYLLITVVAN